MKELFILDGRRYSDSKIARRNWDYRFSWIRDSSFTIYILLRMGFTEEADAYMEFVNAIFSRSAAEQHGLRVMYTIRGETEIPEVELGHLDGYKGSRPVRIGNGAASHQQLDIYGELMVRIVGLAGRLRKRETSS